MVELGAKRIERLVEEGQVDVGIVVLPIDKKKFDIVPFIKEEFMLFVHPNHTLANESTVQLQQLADERFILFNREFTLHSFLIEQCQLAGFTPTIAYESSQWDLITELVIAQLGITLLPKLIYEKMDKEAISMIPLHSPPMWELAIITKKDTYRSYAVRKLQQFLTENFS